MDAIDHYIIVESTDRCCSKSYVRALSLFKLITFANQCVVTLLVSKRFWRDREQEVAFAHDVWGRHPVEILLNASEDSNVQGYETAVGHAISCDLQRPLLSNLTQRIYLSLKHKQRREASQPAD